MLQEIRSRNLGLGFRAKEVVRGSLERVGSLGLSRIPNPAGVEDGLENENFIPDQSPANVSEKH